MGAYFTLRVQVDKPMLMKLVRVYLFEWRFSLLKKEFDYVRRAG
jgi:hypothetical protein